MTMPCDTATINPSVTETSVEVTSFNVDGREEEVNMTVTLENTSSESTAQVSGVFTLDIGNDGTTDHRDTKGVYLTIGDVETLSRTFQLDGLESDTTVKGCYNITDVS